MQYCAPPCQLDDPPTGDSRAKSTPEVGTPCPHDTPTNSREIEHASDYSASRGTLVRGTAQEIQHTASRRSGPRRWLRAVTWLIAAGLHPRANATTLRIAEDLATRMNYDTGHAIYDLDGTAHRLNVHRATVKRHVKYLRELGALVWVSHGTQHNSRRARGLTGYAGTATIYAATIPPVYDHAMGHRVHGTGYTARIVIDQRGQKTPSSTPEPVDNSSSSQGCAPLSLTWVTEDGQVQMVGGSKDTPRKRASRQTASTPHHKTASNSTQPRRSPLQVARDIQIARQVRPRVNWTQAEGLRRLAFALRPLIDRGLNADSIATELHSWWLDWRPAKPASYIRAELVRQAAEGRMTSAPQVMSPAEWDAYHQQRAAEQQALEEQRAAAMAERTDQERREARQAAQFDLSIVADHLAEYGEDDAIDLYGAYLTARADRLLTSSHIRMGAR